jgi:ketosteroid isomerase-like protein
VTAEVHDAHLSALRLADRIEIEQAMYACGKAADTADVEGQVRCFHEDCRVRLGGGAWVEGHADLRTAFHNAAKYSVRTSRTVTNISICFTGDDTATSESLVTAWHRDPRGKEWVLRGWYLDAWRRDDDGWKVLTRELRVAGASEGYERNFTMLDRASPS